MNSKIVKEKKIKGKKKHSRDVVLICGRVRRRLRKKTKRNKTKKRRKRKSSSCPGSFSFCCRVCVFLTRSLVVLLLHIVHYGAPCWVHHHHHHSAAPSVEEQRNDFVFPDVPAGRVRRLNVPPLFNFLFSPSASDAGTGPSGSTDWPLEAPPPCLRHTWTPLPWRCSI